MGGMRAQAGRKALNVGASSADFQLGRTVLEQAVRQACASLVAEAEAAKSGALEYTRGTGGASLVARLLDVTLHLGAQRQIEPGMLLEVSGLEKCCAPCIASALSACGRRAPASAVVGRLSWCGRYSPCLKELRGHTSNQ